jgi:hypothetical protein
LPLLLPERDFFVLNVSNKRQRERQAMRKQKELPFRRMWSVRWWERRLGREIAADTHRLSEKSQKNTQIRLISEETGKRKMCGMCDTQIESEKCVWQLWGQAVLIGVGWEIKAERRSVEKRGVREMATHRFAHR